MKSEDEIRTRLNGLRNLKAQGDRTKLLIELIYQLEWVLDEEPKSLEEELQRSRSRR